MNTEKTPIIVRNANGVAVLVFDNCKSQVLSEANKGMELNTYDLFRKRAYEYKNITTEYLANTYGEVKSKEHAEFIVKLAEVNGFYCVGEYCSSSKYFNFYEGVLSFWEKESTCKINGHKQITIPLPPECEKLSIGGGGQPMDHINCRCSTAPVLSDEWPKVGDIVIYHSVTPPLNHEDCNLDEHCIVDTWFNGDELEVIAIVSKRGNGNLPVVQNKRTHEVSSILTEHIKKTKTPEQELAEKLIEKYKHLSKEEQAFSIAIDIIQNAIDKYDIKKKL